MLKDKISKDLTLAMKNKDEKLVMALRNIRTKIIEAEKKQVETQVSDQEVISILSKLAKERKQSIEAYQKANRNDLVENEIFELKVIESYLPKQMSNEEITEKVLEIIKENNFSTIKDMGKVMKIFNEKYAGQADNKIVSDIVKSNLS
ncbi:MAG: aspartyl-tRNA amidotransferase subunit B [Candidatus Sericytochromatia bacterium]|nr:MAG: aspartyl-tRNA amidotransferase subunit B [Candidatus Sericytochromatia bacterium]